MAQGGMVYVGEGMPGRLAMDGGDRVRRTDYPEWPISGEREEELLLEVVRSKQWGGYHPMVEKFEKLFAGMHDARHAIACANGTVAIELALYGAGIGPGDEVIVPAHSFISTASAVSRVGAIPVFADLEDGTYNLDPGRISEAVTGKTKAVIVVHFSGIMADMDRMEEAARRHGLVVVEDAAHAPGAEWKGRRAGSMGLAGTFSFQNSKVMTSGEGGLVTTSDDEVAERVRSYLNCGRRPGHGWFDHFITASNYRLSGFQAAVLTAQLERLPKQIRRREKNAGILEDAVTADGVSFQSIPDGVNTRSCYLVTGAIQADTYGMTRDEFVAAMRAEGIPCSPFYGHPLYKNPMYETVAHRAEPCPVAERACETSFWLPLKTLMGSEEDALDVSRAINKIHGARKPAAVRRQPTVN